MLRQCWNTWHKPDEGEKMRKEEGKGGGEGSEASGGRGGIRQEEKASATSRRKDVPCYRYSRIPVPTQHAHGDTGPHTACPWPLPIHITCALGHRPAMLSPRTHKLHVPHVVVMWEAALLQGPARHMQRNVGSCPAARSDVRHREQRG